jgi:hypothetical protein
MQMAPMSSPDAMRGSQRCFCDSLPWFEHVVGAHAVHALAERADPTTREFGVHHGLVAEIPAAATVFRRHV